MFIIIDDETTHYYNVYKISTTMLEITGHYVIINTDCIPNV